MLAITASTSSPHVEINFSPREEKSILLNRQLKLLNTTDSNDLVILIINKFKEAAFGIETALFFSITQALPIAFERLWVNGAKQYQNTTYLLLASARLDGYCPYESKKGSRMTSALTLIDAVCVGLRAVMTKPHPDIASHLLFLKNLIEKGGDDWSELNLNALFDQFNASSKYPDGSLLGKGEAAYKNVIASAFQPNIIKKIAESEYFLLSLLLDYADHHIAVLLLNALCIYPEIKALINKQYSSKSLGTFTILHLAIMRTSPIEVIECLLKQGADVNIRTRDGFTPLHLAVNGGLGYHQTGELSIEDGTLIDSDFSKFSGIKKHKEEEGLEAFLWTEQHNNIADLLIASGADLNATDNPTTSTPFTFAITALNPGATTSIFNELKEKFKAGAFLFEDIYFAIENCIISYCQFRRGVLADTRFIAIMQLFMQHGFSRSIRFPELEKRFNTSLLKKDRPGIYYWLAGSANSEDEFIIAIRNGQKDALESFLSRADNIDQVWLDEALVNAIVFGQTSIASLLLDKGANIHQPFHHTNLLHLVDIEAKYGKDLVKFLLKKGVFDNENFKDFPFIENFSSAELKPFRAAHREVQKAREAEKVTIVIDSPLSTVADSVHTPVVVQKPAAAEIVKTAKEVSVVSSLSKKTISIEEKEEKKYVANLIIDLNQELEFIRKYIDEGKIAEAKDDLESYESMIRELEVYNTDKKNRTLFNQYSRHHNQLERLSERIEKIDSGIVGLPISHKVKSSKVVASAGAGAIDDSDKEVASTVGDNAAVLAHCLDKANDTKAELAIDSVPTLEAARIDLSTRINELAKARTEHGVIADYGMHYNMIRLFELWSSKNSKPAATLRQHLLHRHFDVTSLDLMKLAEDIANIIRGFPEIDLDAAILKTTYYKAHIAHATRRYFTDDRSDEDMARNVIASLATLREIYEQFESMPADITMDDFLRSHPELADAVRMHIVKLGELLRCQDVDFTSSPGRQYLMTTCERAEHIVMEFCDLVCQARNVACHTTNFKKDKDTGALIKRERLAPPLIFKIMRMACEINRVSMTKSATSSGVAAVLLHPSKTEASASSLTPC